MSEIDRIRCAVYPGGTGKGVMFRENELPSACGVRSKSLLSIFGSPDAKQTTAWAAQPCRLRRL
jgi:2-methylaconitate cis-trans-isomerase PrpF